MNEEVKSRNYYSFMILVFGIVCVIGLVITVSMLYSKFSDKSFYDIIPNVAELFMSYFAIGAILKFVDDAYDENRFPKNLAILATAISFVVALKLALINSPTAVIFLALVIGVTAMGKTTIPPFFIGTIAYIGSYFIFNIFDGFNWLLFAVILITLFADEVGAEWAKKVLKSDSSDFSNKYRALVYFLRDRNIGLSILLILVFIGWLPLLNWLAWFFLDFGYIIVEGISLRENLTKILSRQVFSKSAVSTINRG
ncbi:MAG: hypothetical protein WA130_21485 [Candidatus Methanoperedens sp.]